MAMTVVPYSCTLIMLLCLMTVQSFGPISSTDNKRGQLSEPFVVGPRYGRSPDRDIQLVVPRNDRFFMGGRYGKRAESTSALYQPTHNTKSGSWSQPLQCEYTGVMQLYRCQRDPKGAPESIRPQDFTYGNDEESHEALNLEK